MSITITSNDKDIKAKAEMLQIKAQLNDLGIQKFPTDYIMKYCPFVAHKQKSQFKTLAQNVWHLRSEDSKILKHFKSVLVDVTKENNEMDDCNVSNLEVNDPKEVKA